MAPGRGHDLADSLYADLFGLDTRDGERRSLFRYFHGRSRLGTWLRAVLAQRVVDQARSARRLRPLPDEGSPEAIVSTEAPPDPERARLAAAMREALDAAVAALEPDDRLRLACYYAKRLRMVQIGRVTGESEATVSRQLARTRRAVRESIERHLHDHAGLDDAGILECFRSVADDAGSLDLREMLNEPPRKKRPSDRSQIEEVT
jgi:RNA polymerase sigma-70 factor (ECF subfamily)